MPHTDSTESSLNLHLGDGAQWGWGSVLENLFKEHDHQRSRHSSNLANSCTPICLLWDLPLRVQSYNAIAVIYINYHGRTRNCAAQVNMDPILSWEEIHCTLHIPGVENSQADLLGPSRGSVRRDLSRCGSLGVQIEQHTGQDCVQNQGSYGPCSRCPSDSLVSAFSDLCLSSTPALSMSVA